MATTRAPAAAMSDGRTIPRLGLGVWQAEPDECYEAVRAALDVGYRHVDTARIYGNEADVGRALRDSGVPRDEVFVTTKLWNADQGHASALKACEQSLKDLKLDYVDLYLIHFPVSRVRGESWRALVELQKRGLARSIGVSNYTVRHLEEMRAASDVAPVLNQVEFHPFLYQGELLAYCREHRILLEAYSPLAHGRKLDDPRVATVARRHGRTNAQVMIRWCLEHGTVVIPKSTRRERIAENFAALDFTLDAADMAALDALDEGLRTCWDPSQVP
jgi:diketogulonate reductase-like aldo/keto reductase